MSPIVFAMLHGMEETDAEERVSPFLSILVGGIFVVGEAVAEYADVRNDDVVANFAEIRSGSSSYTKLLSLSTSFCSRN